MSNRTIIVLVVIVLLLAVLYAVIPSGRDGPSPAHDSANPHAIDQD